MFPDVDIFPSTYFCVLVGLNHAAIDDKSVVRLCNYYYYYLFIFGLHVRC